MSKLHSGLYDSNEHTWKTPSNLIAAILEGLEIEKFDIDVAASCCHVPAYRYFMPNGIAVDEDGHLSQIELGDGLEAEWRGICWMNPPYGNLLQKFVRKAHYESLSHIEHTQTDFVECHGVSKTYNHKQTRILRESTKIIAVLPFNRLETAYYHDHVLRSDNTSIFLFQGKISFEKASQTLAESFDQEKKQKYNTAPFAVGLVFWNIPNPKVWNIIQSLESNGYKGSLIKGSLIK